VHDELAAYIEEMIQKRQEAKKNKDYALADKIRAELLEKGIMLEDTRQGVNWKKIN
jgi:cysteinyl-tRNA synthetase